MGIHAPRAERQWRYGVRGRGMGHGALRAVERGPIFQALLADRAIRPAAEGATDIHEEAAL
jgi:hypothetical protein